MTPHPKQKLTQYTSLSLSLARLTDSSLSLSLFSYSFAHFHISLLTPLFSVFLLSTSLSLHFSISSLLSSSPLSLPLPFPLQKPTPAQGSASDFRVIPVVLPLISKVYVCPLILNNHFSLSLSLRCILKKLLSLLSLNFLSLSLLSLSFSFSFRRKEMLLLDVPSLLTSLSSDRRDTCAHAEGFDVKRKSKKVSITYQFPSFSLFRVFTIHFSLFCVRASLSLLLCANNPSHSVVYSVARSLDEVKKRFKNEIPELGLSLYIYIICLSN